MAATENSLYPMAKERLLSGSLSLSGAIRARGAQGTSYLENGRASGSWSSPPTFVSLISSSYTYSEHHVYFSQGVQQHQVGTTGTLAAPTIASGVFDADDITFSSVPAGSVINQVVLWQSGTMSGAVCVVNTAGACAQTVQASKGPPPSLCVDRSPTANVVGTGQGLEGRDHLVAHVVSSSGAAISLTTNGGDITINWNSSGIFTL